MKRDALKSELLNRNLVILVLAQATAVTGTVALVTLGGIVGRDLAPTATLSTLPISLQVVGTAAATVFAAWTMSRIGRANGFALGAVLGAIGAGVAVIGVLQASFVVFCAGAMLVGVANAFSQQYRFAAAESVSSRSAGYAISITLAGSMIGAVAGPELAARGEDWISGARFAGTFVAVVGCYLLAAVLLLGLRSQPVSRIAEPAVDATSELRPLSLIARHPAFIVAVLGAAVGHGVMSFAMTAAPLAMHVVDGHSLSHTAAVIQAHVLAMYAPSLVSGTLIARYGGQRVMLIGATVLLAMVVIGFAGREVMHYGVSMVALGVGWNFLYTGGTTVLSSAHRTAERFRAQAANDFTVFTISALGSLSAGTVMQVFGWNVVLAVSVPIILVALGALAWIRLPRTGTP